MSLTNDDKFNIVINKNTFFFHNDENHTVRDIDLRNDRKLPQKKLMEIQQIGLAEESVCMK